MSSIQSKLVNLGGNITGTLPAVNGGTGVTTSTGSGSVVLSTSPTFVTPVLGVASSTSVSFAGGGVALAWYEEGTFTPTVAATGTSGAVTYGTQVGSFTRIGRLVHFTIYVTWTNWTGSPTGIVQIGALPYVQKVTAGLYGAYAVMMDNVTMPSGTLWVCGQAVLGAAGINLAAAKAVPGVSAANSVFIDPSTNAGSATRGVFLSGSYAV